MSLFKSPAWLEDSVKFFTYSSLACGVLASAISYIFGKEDKTFLALLLTILFISLVVSLRIITLSFNKLSEAITVLEGPEAKIPKADERKDLAARLKETRNYTTVLMCASIVAVIGLACAMCYEHWPQKDLTKKPDKLAYITCKLINPADNQDLFHKWPFLEPVKIYRIPSAF